MSLELSELFDTLDIELQNSAQLSSAIIAKMVVYALSLWGLMVLIDAIGVKIPHVMHLAAGSSFDRSIKKTNRLT